MKDRKKVIDGLEQIILHFSVMADSCDRRDEPWYCELQEFTAEAIVALKEGNWISTDEQKPRQGETVIIAIYGSDVIVPHKGESMEDCIKRLQRECRRVTLGFMGEDGWYNHDGWPEIIQPSYWMKLPEPPMPPED